MNIISRLFKKNKQQRADLALIGPPGSGKTTLIRYLETGKEVEDTIHTTIGIEVRESPRIFGNWKFITIDTGGQPVYQQTFWELAVQNADLVLFVIDATIHPERNASDFELAVAQIDYALDIISEDQPILVLLNKQDLVDLSPLNIVDAIHFYNLNQYVNHTIGVIPISAKYGTGVMTALTWIIDHLNQTKA